ncbi:MAG: hypothetical protein MK085_08475 [Phycisphaerales bacterium]|nr:hypothetical protein [Phycisphaerales bacterium]
MTALAGNSSLRWWVALPLVLVPLVVVLVVTAFLPPGWWAPAEKNDPVVSARAADLEQDVTAAVHAIREDPAPWGFRLTQQQANEWLATRLPAWIDHDEGLDWPPGIQVIQVEFATGGFQVAASSGEGLVWRARFAASIEGGVCRLQPVGAGIGRLPVPGFGVQGLLAVVPEGTLAPDGSIELPVELDLVDGRTVRLLDFEFSEGDLAILFETLLAGEAAQDPQAGVSMDNAEQDHATRTHDAR